MIASSGGWSQLRAVLTTKRGRPSKVSQSFTYWQPGMSAAEFAAEAGISEPTARKYIAEFERHAA